jgi:hypothetical protein
MAGEGSQSVAVFAGTAPIVTRVLAGSVLDGSDPARPPLNGATVEILNGLVAGRTAVSGVAPAFVPGFWPPVSSYPAGEFDIFGVPSGIYRLRVSKPGYIPQERDTAGSLIGNTVVLFRQ